MQISVVLRKFCDYGTFIRGYSPRTVGAYKYTVRYLSSFVGVDDLEAITSRHVHDFLLDGRANKGWTVSTYCKYLKTLRPFFAWCLKEGYIEYNPAADIEMPKLEKTLPKSLPRQDTLKLLELAYNYPYKYRILRSRNHAILATFIFAGLRKKELLDLRCSDVNLEGRTLFVRQGKGAKDRMVPMCSALVESLARYLGHRKRLQRTCPEFFVSCFKDMGVGETALRDLVHTLVQASGIRFGAHKLRHTFATLMLEGGCDIYSLSKMMGHSDIKTTTIYLAVSPQHLREQIGKHPLNSIAPSAQTADVLIDCW